MLKGKLIHPQILEALGRAGHESKILIADGNFPHSFAQGKNAVLVNLNLSPGCVTTTQVLEALVSAVPIENAWVMQVQREGQYAMAEDPPVWADFQRILRGANNGGDPAWGDIEKFSFYETVQGDDTCLIIATGDQALYANLFLKIGAIKP